MNEYRRLAIQVLAGDQPAVKKIIDEHLEADIDDLTVREITEYIKDNIEHFNNFIQ